METRSTPGRRWRVAIAAGVLLAAFLATAPIVPLFDPDEGYYPATAAETLALWHGWDPHFDGEVRWDKPILPYALIEAGFSLFGRNVTAARLPSALEGLAMVLIVGLAVRRLAGARAGVLAAAVVATTAGVQLFARAAHPEISVVLAIVTAEILIVFWLVAPSRGPTWKPAIAAGAVMGYGVLAKGPVAIALPAIATLAVAPVVWPTDRPWRRVLRDGALAGLTTLAVAVPWYAEMSLRYGDAFLDEALWRHNVGRFVGTSYAHEKPVWYFVLPTLLLLVPWTAFLPAAVKSALSKRREPRNVLRLLMASAGITAFLFYSLSASKLPNYAFVIVPPLAIVIAMHLDDRLSVAAPGRTAFHVTGFLLLAVALALLAVPWTVGTVFKAREIVGGAPGSSADLFWLFGRAAWPSAAVLGIGGLLSFVGTPTRRLIALGLVGAVWPLALFIGAQPLLALSYPWAHFGQELAGTSGQVWLIGPRAPSLTFYAGRSVARVDPSQHDTNLRLESDGWIVADSAWLAEHAGHSDFDRVSVDVVDECGTMSLARLHAR